MLTGPKDRRLPFLTYLVLAGLWLAISRRWDGWLIGPSLLSCASHLLARH